MTDTDAPEWPDPADEAHADLRRELLKRSIQAAADDPRPGIPAEEVRKHLLELRKEPRHEPASQQPRR